MCECSAVVISHLLCIWKLVSTRCLRWYESMNVACPSEKKKIRDIQSTSVTNFNGNRTKLKDFPFYCFRISNQSLVFQSQSC